MRNMNCQRMHSSPQNNNCGFGMNNIETGCRAEKGNCHSCPTDKSGCNPCQTEKNACSSCQPACDSGMNRYGNFPSRCDSVNDGCDRCQSMGGMNKGGRGPCNRISDEGCDGCSSRHNDPLLGMPVGIGYVPWQQWGCMFDLETGLNKGTMFPSLSLPFRGCIPNCHSHKGGAL